MSQKRWRIFTVGHSNRSLQAFFEILDARKLKLLIDVRTIPKSRHNPQFAKQRLTAALKKHGIEYRHFAGLGGLRPPKKDSINTGWRNASFRGYADYMQTPEFAKNLKRLIQLSKRKRLVLMCAEAVPWRCHRSLIADALNVHGIPVLDLINKSSSREHRLTRFARVRHGRLTYPRKNSCRRLKSSTPAIGAGSAS